jgi:hypothetical protein
MATDDGELINFRAPKDFGDRLSKEAFDLDISKSAFIRAAIMLGSPILRDKPYLVRVLDSTRNGNGK